MTGERIAIARPDDWHLHLRDGPMLHAVVGFSAAVFGRAIVMPNLVPPVRIPAEAEAYRSRIRAALPDGHPFEPLMTAYMTDSADPADIRGRVRERRLPRGKTLPPPARRPTRRWG